MCGALIMDIYKDDDTYYRLAEEIGLLPLLNGLMQPDPNDRQADLAAVSATGPWTGDEEFQNQCASDAGERTRKLSIRDALPQGVPKPPLKSSPVRLFV